MPFNLESIKKFANDSNISFSGVIHVGTHSKNINQMYNLLNIHDNNIIWVESDKKRAQENQSNGLPNVFTTIIDELDSAVIYNNKHNLELQPCTLECCIEVPKLIISETNDYKIQPLKDFLELNNFDPCEYNVWNFDCNGSELRIFRGAQHLLKYVDIIYTGVNSTEISKKNNTMSEIDQLLNKHGLIRVETIKNEDNWCMAIYVRI